MSLTFEDALHIARSCAGYTGGFVGRQDYISLFKAGVGAVISALEDAINASPSAPSTPHDMETPAQADSVHTAKGFLEEAYDTLTQRGQTYDRAEGERSMGPAIAAFNIIAKRDLTESEGWLLQQILKDVRQWSAPAFHPDSALDCIGFAALKAEALASGK